MIQHVSCIACYMQMLTANWCVRSSKWKQFRRPWTDEWTNCDTFIQWKVLSNKAGSRAAPRWNRRAKQLQWMTKGDGVAGKGVTGRPMGSNSNKNNKSRSILFPQAWAPSLFAHLLTSHQFPQRFLLGRWSSNFHLLCCELSESVLFREHPTAQLRAPI